MKISSLQQALENMKNHVGDLDVRILDDESGDMESVEAVFHFKVGAINDDWVELCTARQADCER